MQKECDNICISPRLSSKDDELIRKVTEEDSKDPHLKDIFSAQVSLDWIRGVEEAAELRGISDPKLLNDFKKEISPIIEMNVNRMWSDRNNVLGSVNRFILEMNKLDSTILPTDEARIFYRYKFNEKIIADKPITTLNTVVPLFANREIENLDLDEIFKVRRFSDWEKAMSEIRELSFNIEAEPYSKEYWQEVDKKAREVLCDFVDSHKQSRLNRALSWVRHGLYCAFDFIIPASGAAMSTADKIAGMFLERHKNQALALFLSSLRRLGPKPTAFEGIPDLTDLLERFDKIDAVTLSEASREPDAWNFERTQEIVGEIIAVHKEDREIDILNERVGIPFLVDVPPERYGTMDEFKTGERFVLTVNVYSAKASEAFHKVDAKLGVDKIFESAGIGRDKLYKGVLVKARKL